MTDGVPEEKDGADETGGIGTESSDEVLQKFVVWVLSELDGEAEGFIEGHGVIGGVGVGVAVAVQVLEVDEDCFCDEEGKTDEGVDGSYS